jgi:hypothetical protein
VFNERQRVCPMPTIPQELSYHALPDISHLEYLAIKSYSPLWSTRQASAHGPLKLLERPPSMASQLPTEIIHQIYYSLSPLDFNAARHSCRSWFINSLHRPMLETILRRGGFYNSILRDIVATHVLNTRVTVNDEWLMSKRLARECALGPDWTGN